jgi:hypothetical protein
MGEAIAVRKNIALEMRYHLIQWTPTSRHGTSEPLSQLSRSESGRDRSFSAAVTSRYRPTNSSNKVPAAGVASDSKSSRMSGKGEKREQGTGKGKREQGTGCGI